MTLKLSMLFFALFFTFATKTEASALAEKLFEFKEESGPSEACREDLDLPEFNYTATVEKNWNFMVHMAANNNLAKNARDNLNQMALVGSTFQVNILVQLEFPNNKELLRLYICKGKIYLLQSIPTTLNTNSGTKETLCSFVKWATNKYPAKHQALIVWNHGSGALDRTRARKAPQAPLFDRRKEKAAAACSKGIAFNDAYGTYLSNHQLQEALEEMVSSSLDGQKIDILGLDACYMSMIEIASHAKKSVDFMVGSSNVEPAAGWNYERVLSAFERETISPYDLAHHIVESYRSVYEPVFQKYTQTALDLSYVQPLENNISLLAGHLRTLFESEYSKPLYDVLKLIRFNKMYTTSFNNLDYIDLYHFYESLEQKLLEIEGAKMIADMTPALTALQEGKALVAQMVIKHAAGSLVAESRGISIYFPLKNLHPSYPKSLFAQSNEWYPFVSEFLKRLNSPAKQST